MKKDDKVYLNHILDAIEKIEGYLQNFDYERFMEDEMRFSATIRQLSIVGEAANKVSDEMKVQHSDVHWREMIGMRNILIHDYSGISNKTVWETCQEDLFPLKRSIENLLN